MNPIGVDSHRPGNHSTLIKLTFADVVVFFADYQSSQTTDTARVRAKNWRGKLAELPGIKDRDRLLRPNGLRLALTLAFAVTGCSGPASQQVQTSEKRSAQGPGVETYSHWCGDCHHTAAGPGSLALARKYQGSLPAVLEERTNTDPELVKYVVRHGASFMPPFRKTEITDAELDQLAAYLANPGQYGQTSQPGGE